ncbi:Uncharacterized conserved protein YbjT, contains NAD(P)-binding and DUF2867 domains [Mucilaginibacter gossypiicola]|uniref:Uncharacterized conserved protein YbjT, contains NAD(P)-binding and DUF2867 domains n=1 Tax=Mucilaginibacter gossypiicola TaxID=551995 RepID=A0A1H8D1S1_9SPHI|nr:NAD(P)H-binding protein [Mucilaginibacter gossypiicola]SEN00437.1 Uncharacterized conserved protein YbjT, contains NAD(P)-binding and DUF2867 domains [Mucilaginibacter gossypiicola]
MSIKNQKKQSSKILVVGATGKVGRQVLKNLIDLGETVRASSRNPQTANFPAAVEAVTFDLERPQTFTSALEGVNKVFLYANNGAIQDFANSAILSSVEHIVLLSSSSVISGDANNFLVQRHLAAEQAIIESGIPFTFLRPGAFSANTLLWRHQIIQANKVRFAYPLAETAPIHEFDIAAVAAKVLTTPGYEGQSPLLTGPESLTQHGQLELISDAIDKKLVFEELEPDEALASMSKNMPPAYANILLKVMKDRVGIPAKISSAVEEITGIPPKNFSTWAQENSMLFQ